MSQYTTYNQQTFLCNGANRNEPNINWLSETLVVPYMVPAQFQQEITALSQNWNLIILAM